MFQNRDENILLGRDIKLLIAFGINFFHDNLQTVGSGNPYADAPY